MENKIWHQESVESVLRELGSDKERGLGAGAASDRLKKYGPNVLVSKKRRGPLRMLLDQFTDFMILVLLAACVISAIIGDVKDSLAILTILVINAVIGFVQEYRAQKAMDALKAMAPPRASVVREGKTSVIAAREVVPGDLVLLDTDAAPESPSRRV
jgi:Ca2+-transporting ATPase